MHKKIAAEFSAHTAHFTGNCRVGSIIKQYFQPALSVGWKYYSLKFKGFIVKSYTSFINDRHVSSAICGSIIGTVFGLWSLIFTENYFSMIFGIVCGGIFTIVFAAIGISINKQNSRVVLLDLLIATISIVLAMIIGGIIIQSLNTVTIPICLGIIFINIHVPIVARIWLNARQNHSH